MKSELIINKKKCCVYQNGGADTFLIQAIDKHDSEMLDQEVEMIKALSHGKPFTLVAFLVDDWNEELSPWNAPAVFGREDFGSGAGKTLSFITEHLLPELNRSYASTEKKRIFIGGYSLSGLFALWVAHQTDIFSGVAAVSPSVWFPGWIQYTESHNIQTPNVYLSLGNKEEKTRNETMATVGENIRRQYELLINTKTVSKCELEWNSGNHFADPERRTAKGFAWLLNAFDQ